MEEKSDTCIAKKVMDRQIADGDFSKAVRTKSMLMSPAILGYMMSIQSRIMTGR